MQLTYNIALTTRFRYFKLVENKHYWRTVDVRIDSWHIATWLAYYIAPPIGIGGRSQSNRKIRNATRNEHRK